MIYGTIKGDARSLDNGSFVIRDSGDCRGTLGRDKVVLNVESEIYAYGL